MRSGTSASLPSGFLGHQSGLMAENNDGDESAQQWHRACVQACVQVTATVPRGKAITAAAVSFFMVSGPPLSKREREEREGEPNPDCEDNIPMSKKREGGREAEYHNVSPSKCLNARAKMLALNVPPNYTNVARQNITYPLRENCLSFSHHYLAVRWDDPHLRSH